MALWVTEDAMGSGDIYPECPSSIASKDFSSMLNERPGCFIRLETGFKDRETFPFHSKRFKFNNDVLLIGVSYWAWLVGTGLI